jgi:hypothetical protein
VIPNPRRHPKEDNHSNGRSPYRCTSYGGTNPVRQIQRQRNCDRISNQIQIGYSIRPYGKNPKQDEPAYRNFHHDFQPGKQVCLGTVINDPIFKIVVFHIVSSFLFGSISYHLFFYSPFHKDAQICKAQIWAKFISDVFSILNTKQKTGGIDYGNHFTRKNIFQFFRPKRKNLPY